MNEIYIDVPNNIYNQAHKIYETCMTYFFSQNAVISIPTCSLT